MCASVTAFTLRASAQTRPNIIIFYVDDLGWQGTQLNDVDSPCPYEAPNVVKLATQGMNFTQAYSAAPTCAPSRAGIITELKIEPIPISEANRNLFGLSKKTERLPGHKFYDKK